jgi:FMNH2-dependent dimethyl sulfone monooxygenase
MHTCTWAPTTFEGHRLVAGKRQGRKMPAGGELDSIIRRFSERIEALGLSHLLVAQRWWGSGEEIEGSSLDATAMTAFFAAYTSSVQLVTAVHPGFFHPAALAKWGASIDRMSGGRWSINVTTGWNLREFDMYGVPALEHDERYARAREFIEVLRGAWEREELSYAGRYFQTDKLRLEPRPLAPLTVFQGGQSDAAIAMGAALSDWMFLNGGSLEKTTGIIGRVRGEAERQGRSVRFALYANPLCRRTDAEAWEEIDRRVAAIDPDLRARRRQTTAGAEGMWAGDDALSHLDTNEGFASRLIGSPETILARVAEFRAAGVDMLHLALGDALFEEQVLPEIVAL